MTDKEKDIKIRIQALERFVRDIKIILVIVGSCIVAFLGWQSYLGIPKAIDDAFKGTAIKSMNDQASKSLADIN
ncbi:MAG: hypothetical protein ABSC54_05325, partial [Smithellaceae bacterium]